MSIIRERVAEHDVLDVLPLDEHVCFANRVTLRIEFLPVHHEPRFGIDLVQMIIGNAEHAARSRGRVVHRAHDAWLRKRIVILNEKKINHEPNDFARREMFARSFVGEFGELANELFEDRTHLRVRHVLRMQIDGGELLADEIEQIRFGEAVDLRVEIKLLEDVAHRWRKPMHIRAQVRAQVVLIAHEFLQIQRRCVVEVMLRRFVQHDLGAKFLLLAALRFFKHRVLRRREHAVKPAQHREGKNDLPVLRLLEIATEQISNRPNERGEVGVGHSVPARMRSMLPQWATAVVDLCPKRQRG